MARWFLLGGGALAVLSLVLWLALPVQLSFPPFLLTALLALAYSAYCFRQGRVVKRGKP
jgi:hypothetical protein